jgi:hypothetical protein
MPNARAFLFVPLGLVLACSRTPEPDPIAKTAAPQASAPIASSSAAPSRQLAWDAPSGWTRADNTSPMRKATYKVPKQAGDSDAPELAISVAGGAIDANIDRWVTQFDEGAKATLKKTTKKIAGYDVTIVELSGTYQGNMMPGAPQTGPKANYALLGAIVPVDNEARWFFKMIGPAKSVTAARADFDTLLASVRPQS